MSAGQLWKLGDGYVKVLYRVGARTTYDIGQALQWMKGAPPFARIEYFVIGAQR
jgi:hypothetical protein